LKALLARATKSSVYSIIYYVKKGIELNSNIDDKAAMLILFNAHCPMEHISGFMQSHSMPLLGECPHHIAPAAVMVFVFGRRKNT
jgi:hypothetical protein